MLNPSIEKELVDGLEGMAMKAQRGHVLRL